MGKQISDAMHHFCCQNIIQLFSYGIGLYMCFLQLDVPLAKMVTAVCQHIWNDHNQAQCVQSTQV